MCVLFGFAYRFFKCYFDYFNNEHYLFEERIDKKKTEYYIAAI